MKAISRDAEVSVLRIKVDILTFNKTYLRPSLLLAITPWHRGLDQRARVTGASQRCTESCGPDFLGGGELHIAADDNANSNSYLPNIYACFF
jgi:hypothetical protein